MGSPIRERVQALEKHMFNLFKSLVDKISFENFLNKNNSNSLTIKSEKIEYHKYGLGFEEVERLTTLVVKEQASKIIEVESKRVFEARVEDFKATIEPMVKELSEREVKQLAEPDTQLMLREAAHISGRRTEKDIRSVLAHLVAKRIKSGSLVPGESLKDIVFKEALSTVGKMTADQLKIVTLCYLLKYTKHNGIKTFEQFDEMLKKCVLPFVEFKNTQTEFQHIEYVGAGSISSLGSSSFSEVFSKEYGLIFSKDISQSDIDSLSLSVDLVDKILYKDGDAFKFKMENKQVLDEVLKSLGLVDEKTIGDINGIWNRSRMSKQEIETVITEKSDAGQKILDVWKDSLLPRLSLTSVGIAIAVTNYEQIVGDTLDIDIWIK